jgi:replicative DNA helicase
MPNLPASIDLERALLGSVLLNDSMFDQLIESLVAEDFFHGGHQKIYARMIELREQNKIIDIALLCELLRQHDEFEKVGGLSYLSELMDGAVERTNLSPYIQTVRQKSVMRGIYRMAEAAMEEAMESNAEPEALLEKMEGFILGATDESAQSRFVTLADAVRDAGSLDNYLGRMLDPVAMTGLPTGYRLLDNVIGGLKPTNFIVVAARPSMGKSALAGNIAENVLLDDPEKVVAMFALEMSKEAVLSRLLASCGRVNVRKVRSGGQVSLVDRQDLLGAIERLIGVSLCIDDSSYLTPIKLRSKCRQLKRQKGRLDLVLVDYLQLMSGGGKFESREKEVSAISRGMKALAKELDVPVVALCQLSRAVEGRSDKTPILSDLRESGSIEQDADVVMFIHRQEVYDSDPDLQGIADIIVAKNREGPTDKVKLAWLKQYTRFENLAMEG